VESPIIVAFVFVAGLTADKFLRTRYFVLSFTLNNAHYYSARETMEYIMSYGTSKIFQLQEAVKEKIPYKKKQHNHQAKRRTEEKI
jgi:hypothetical protein